MASDLAVPEGLNRVNPSVMEDVSRVLGNFSDYMKSSSKSIDSLVSTLKKSNQIEEKKDKEDKKDKAEAKKNNKALADKFKNDARSSSKGGKSDGKNLLNAFKEGLKSANMERNAMGTLLGPLNLLLTPLHDAFKLFGPVFKIIGGTFGKLFSKITGKQKPNSSDVAKTGPLGIGALYIGGLLEKIFGKKAKGKDGEGGGLLGGIGNLFKGAVAKNGLKNTLIKGGGIAMLAGGLIWGAIDGIQGWIKSQDWGTSKIGGFLGGFLGGTGKGTKNAFKNAGKFALMGAGAGTLICPPIGTIVGGLAGAAVGGLMGYFGGEEMAKQIDDIFNVSKFKKIWKDDKTSITKKVGLTVLEGVSTVVQAPFKIMGKIGGGIAKGVEKLVDTVGPVIKQDCQDMANAWKKGGIKEAFKTGFDKIKERTKNFLENTPVGQWINDSIVKPIGNFFRKIQDISGYVASGGLKGLLERNELGISEYDVYWNTKDKLSDITRDKLIKNLGKWAVMTKNDKYNSDDDLKNMLKVGEMMRTLVQGEDYKKKSAYEQSVMFSEALKGFEEDTRLSKGAELFKKAMGDFTNWDKITELLEEDVDANKETADNTAESNILSEVKQDAYSINVRGVKDAILRPDGSVIETDPQDTLVALKNIPNSMTQVQSELARTTRDSISSINGKGFSSEIENKLNDIANILNQILSKDVQVNLPQQTRYDLDLVMSGGLL